MPHHLDFETLISYDLHEDGITVPTVLQLSGRKTTLEAKIDTGSTYCVMKRQHGEALNIDIESGLRLKIGTRATSRPSVTPFP